MQTTILKDKPFLYGTAWKEAQTARLTRLAIEQGFRGIDTANQRKHYDEASVGQAFIDCVHDGLVTREEMFLQTKFTFQAGQDHRLPYDPAASIAMQVKQSFTSSLEHLHTRYLDSYVLHGPSRRSGLAQADWDAWRAMEELFDQGLCKSLGVSNVSLEQLQQLTEKSRVRPTWVQNRCYAVTGWDHDVRQYCRANGMVYQGFSLLTANSQLFSNAGLRAISAHHDRHPMQIIFRFAVDAGMLPLTGTSSADHMKADLDIFGFKLSLDEINAIERLALV